MDKRTTESAIAVLCVIGTVLLILNTYSPAPPSHPGSRKEGKYFFSSTLSSTTPHAKCHGYLELDYRGAPILLSFTLSGGGGHSEYLKYLIGKKCHIDSMTGETVYRQLSPKGRTNTLSRVQLRVPSNGRACTIILKDPPSPWNLRHRSLIFKIRNSRGRLDWRDVPNITSCATESHPVYQHPTVGSLNNYMPFS